MTIKEKPELGPISEDEKRRFYDPIPPYISANAIDDDYIPSDLGLEVRLVDRRRVIRVTNGKI